MPFIKKNNGCDEVCSKRSEDHIIRREFKECAKMEGYSPPEYFRPFKDAYKIALALCVHDPDRHSLGAGSRSGNGKICGISIGYGQGDSVYYPFAHFNRARCVAEPLEFVKWLKDQSEQYSGELIGYDIKYCLDWLDSQYDISFPKAKLRDIQIIESLIDENQHSYTFEAIAYNHLPKRLMDGIFDISSLYGVGYRKRFEVVDPGWAAKYFECQTNSFFYIHDMQIRISNSQGLGKVYDLECDLIRALLLMRAKGVMVDKELAFEKYEEAQEKLDIILARIKEISEVAVNVWSATSVANAFNRCGINYPKSHTGYPSFSKLWLDRHPSELAKCVSYARSYDKIGNSYLKDIIEKYSHNGRIHTTFNQVKVDNYGAVSGRISSCNPNLQQIPARHPELGKICRSIFLPESEQMWGSIDFSQIEYRLFAHFASLDNSLAASSVIDKYKKDKKADFHHIASEITGLSREEAKQINFGVLYGMGQNRMASLLGASQEAAKSALNTFHSQAPFIKQMHKKYSLIADEKGFITTIMGRRCRFKKSASGGAEGGHKALNYLLQGSAADMMKKSLVDAYKAGIFEELTPHITVHDEINISVKQNANSFESFRGLVDIMQNAIRLNVPVSASYWLGFNWGECK